MGKLPLSFFSLATKIGEGEAARRRRPGRRPWARWRSRGGGKGRGSRGGSIPPLNLGGGGLLRCGHGGGRRGGSDRRDGSAAGLSSGPDPRKKEEGTSGVLVPTSARAVVQWGGELRGDRRPGAAAMVGGGVGAWGEG